MREPYPDVWKGATKTRIQTSWPRELQSASYGSPELVLWRTAVVDDGRVDLWVKTSGKRVTEVHHEMMNAMEQEEELREVCACRKTRSTVADSAWSGECCSSLGASMIDFCGERSEGGAGYL